MIMIPHDGVAQRLQNRTKRESRSRHTEVGLPVYSAKMKQSSRKNYLLKAAFLPHSANATHMHCAIYVMGPGP